MIGGHLMKKEDNTQILDVDEKMEAVATLRINYPRFNRALKLIEKCHMSTKYSTEPLCMLITAPSGTGKSTLFDYYVSLHDKLIYQESSTKRVILWDEIPSPTSISTVTEALLSKLGDPFPTRGTVGNKNHRLVNLIKDCKIELILLDEFQHFVHTENKKINFEVADWFKSLVNKTRVPVILFGLEESKLVLNANEQLNSRFKVKYHLYPFNFNEDRNVQEFRRLLDEISSQLPFDNQPTLAQNNMPDKLMYSSNGLMRPLMSIIREAASIAIHKEKPYVDEYCLSDAFELFARYGKEVNPFLDDEFEI